MTVRVRMAPSPTGEPHIGNVRTAVFNWLFARKMGGQFILRIEDTDRTRFQPETVQIIMDGLRWLGLDWDEGPGLESLLDLGVENAEAYAVGGPYGPYIQSERLAMYKEVAEELIDRGQAYRCNCTPERLKEVRQRQRARQEMVMYDRHCRHLPPGSISVDEPHVIRLKIPLEGHTIVSDTIKGEVSFENANLDDQVLLKSDGYPTYHLAVVVDDHFMQISHIIRGDDWIPSTPKRILIYQAMGWPLPIYCHVPLVNGPDGKKLSKRHGATSITEFRDQGYLPEALFNFLSLLGWAPGEGGEQEIFSREALIERFDLHRINRAAAAFSYNKLDWMNGAYIRSLSQRDLLSRLLPIWQKANLVPDPCLDDKREALLQIVPLIQERLIKLNDVLEWTTFLFQDIEPPSAGKLIGKKMTAEESLSALRHTRDTLVALEPFETEGLEQSLRALVEELGLSAGQLFGILRWAVSGQKVAPPLFGSMAFLGREKVVARINAAEKVLAASM